MDQQQPPSTTGYKNEWPVYPELRWGHELCPSPRLQPFAPFRNCQKPIPPPHRKTAAELAHEAREKAWVERQIYLTNLRGRNFSIIPEPEESESEQEAQAQEENRNMAIRESFSSAKQAWSAFLSKARDLVFDGLDFVAVLINWFYHLVIILTIIMFLASAFQDPVQILFGKLVALFKDDVEPEEVRYVLVQNYRSWSVAQQC
ncbi:hypothetical protein PG990_003547 [Apiospora arundinis]